MSFLDNLENNLKALENREEKDGREAQRREEERVAAQALAPWGNQLRDSAYASKLLGLAARAGQQRRTKIFPAWMDTTLRLDLRGQKLELRPTKSGILAVFLNGLDELHQEPVDLEGDPKALLDSWLEHIPAQPA